MSIVNLIRTRSSFNNVRDGFEVCPNNDPNAILIDEFTQELQAYELPEQYNIAECVTGEWFIYNDAGDHCEIIEHEPTGIPQLFDGTKNAPVLKKA